MAIDRGKEGFMSTALKLLLLPALVVAFSVGVALAATGGSDDGEPAPLPASSSTTIESGTTSTERGTTTVEDGNDISGPCDEAEHADDPRCTGGAPVGGSGPGPGRDDDRDDDDRSGRSGPDNSGPGSDSSGPGSGGDDDHGD
ncbi:MAG: hypothetical protein ACRDNR_16085 [Gaiellaceae bacterium]